MRDGVCMFQVISTGNRSLRRHYPNQVLGVYLSRFGHPHGKIEYMLICERTQYIKLRFLLFFY